MRMTSQAHRTAMIVGTFAIIGGTALAFYSKDWQGNALTIFLGICLLGVGWFGSSKTEDPD